MRWGMLLPGIRRRCRAKTAFAHALRCPQPEALRPTRLDTGAYQGARHPAHLVAFLLVLVITACTPEPRAHDLQSYPLAALDLHAEDPTLGRDFWMNLACAQDPSWPAALNHCQGQADPSPNCKNVLRLGAAIEVPGFAQREEVSP